MNKIEQLRKKVEIERELAKERIEIAKLEKELKDLQFKKKNPVVSKVLKGSINTMDKLGGAVVGGVMGLTKKISESEKKLENKKNINNSKNKKVRKRFDIDGEVLNFGLD